MHRRRFLKTAATMPLAAALHGRASAARESLRERMIRMRAEALAAFPYERVEVGGGEALRAWEELRTAGRGAPVVVGGEEAFGLMLEPFHPDYWKRSNEPVLAETLAEADRLTHPDSLMAHRRAEEAGFRQWCRDNPQSCTLPEASEEESSGTGIDSGRAYEPPVGEWPEQPPGAPGLSVVRDLLTWQPLDSVTIVLVPTDDWTTIPAYLRWGHWNANPPPEVHVAALRSWRDRYGAELVGLSNDVMNIRVAAKPASRDEAMALALEHYAYCNDIVDQGVGTLTNLAAALMANDWWFFWWD